jgi:hypothetical protein
MHAIDQRIAELEAHAAAAPDRAELLWRLAEARALRALVIDAATDEWARAVRLARALAQRGESAQAVLDALLLAALD